MPKVTPALVPAPASPPKFSQAAKSLFFKSGHGRALGYLLTLDKLTQEQLQKRLDENKEAQQQRITERQQSLKNAAQDAGKKTERQAQQEAGQRLQARKHDEARDEDEEPEERHSAVPPISRPLTSRLHDGVGVGSASKSISKSQGKRCYTEDEVPPFVETPVGRIPTGTPFDRKMENTMTGLGSSDEQLRRLETIYENQQRPIAEQDIATSLENGPKTSHNTSLAVPRYVNHMHDLAVKNGREVMDRSQDIRAAIGTDRQVYQALRQEYNVNEANWAISIASPNTANISREQKETYIELLGTPDQVPVKGSEMIRGLGGQVRGGSNNDLLMVLAQAHGLDSRKPTEADNRMFQAEAADLRLSKNPGKKISPQADYQRQLGEQIRLHGRDGLAKERDECGTKTLTVDQFIAARMRVSGYEKKEIENATADNSPSTAFATEQGKALYIRDDIKPVLDSENTQFWKSEMDLFRQAERVPDDIQRADCLQKIEKATTAGTWNPSTPEKTCSGYQPSGKDRTQELDIEY